MSRTNNNNVVNIEKYDFENFEIEKKPFTIILTDVIQMAPPEHIKEVFLWIFLQSLPSTWVPNKQHLMNHFNISARTYENWMSWLRKVGLIDYRQDRKSSGAFGKGTLIVLNGTLFNLKAEDTRTAKNCDPVKTTKVIHNFNKNRTAKNCDPVESSIVQSQSDLSAIQPHRKKTAVRLNCAHINNINKDIKEREKINNEPCSVFSNSYDVKNHTQKIIANRKGFVEEEVIDQIVFYCFESTSNRDFDSVNKKINVALKLIRQGKWNIPNGYKGISYQAIKEQEELNQNLKENQWKEEAIAAKAIFSAVSKGLGYQGFHNFVEKFKSEQK